MSGGLAVVVPVFDEAAGIRPTLLALAAQRDDDFDVVFVDNGSRDGSADVMRLLYRRVLNQQIKQRRLIGKRRRGHTLKIQMFQGFGGGGPAGSR